MWTLGRNSGTGLVKQNWSDALLRDHGHWDIVPNGERHRYAVADVASVRDARILTVTRETQNWHLLPRMPFLEELTLHKPTPEQIAQVSQLWRLRRLRITHARPASLEPLARLSRVRELVLEYVSGVDDLSPIARMEGLRSLHLELLRRVRDFSPLGQARNLRYLSISGGVDFIQPIDGFDFLPRLQNLDVLRMSFVRVPRDGMGPAAGHMPKGLKHLGLDPNALPLHDFARLSATLPAAQFAPWTYVPFNHIDVPSNDIRSRLPVDVMMTRHPEVILCDDGRRLLPDMKNGRYYLLGRGFRSLPPSDRRLMRKLEDHEALFDRLVSEVRISDPEPVQSTARLFSFRPAS